jgi:hypothetical protein
MEGMEWQTDGGATVCEADPETRVFEDLREALGVRASWCAGEGSFQWTLCGAVQRAWRVPTMTSGHVPTWRLQLRTYVVDGFSGSPAQLSVLSSDLTAPTLAGLVRTAYVPARLELASALDVPGGDLRHILQAVVVTARSQAAEAGYLSLSGRLTSVGLVPRVDLEAAAQAESWRCSVEGVVGSREREVERACGTCSQIDAWIDVLRQQTRARAVRTPEGICATFPAGESRSILELNADAVHPMLGKGLSAVLTVPLRVGPTEAMMLNEREVGPQCSGDALGGWRATDGSFLVHSSFYPYALQQEGLGLPLLLAYARRAHEVAILCGCEGR